MENKNKVDFKFAKIYKDNIFKKKRYKLFFGGRGAGRTHSISRYILIRAMKERIRVWCAREKQNSIAQSVHHIFVELINLYNLNAYFNITKDDITCTTTGSYFMFKGFRGDAGQYSAEGLKAYEDFDILWIEEASACQMDSLMVVSKTIRKEGSEIIASFNRVLEEDPIWRFGCYDVGDIYTNKVFEDKDRIVIYANLDDNPFASETLRQDREQDKKRLSIDEWNQVWLGYPDRSAGFKAFITRDAIYGEKSIPTDEETQMYEVVCGFDPNGGGKDTACAVARQGRKILEIKVIRDVKDPLDLANLFLNFKRKYNATKAYCDKGYGLAVLAIAKQMHESIIPVDFGGRANDADTYGNKRAEIYGRLRDWLDAGGYLGDPKNIDVIEVKRELQSIEYNLRKSDEGVIYLCSKDDIRKRIGRSPDRADALALTFSGFKDKIVRNDRGIFIDDSDDYKVDNFDNVDTLNLI